MEPVFLALDEVVEIHRDQIERYGGSPGIRDIELLQSAVAMPSAAREPGEAEGERTRKKGYRRAPAGYL
ncbi:MAG: hypothetical protein HZB83_07060 [Deltaproteobacteria bacterium]|nr:hypothetical protein [Deltaproteobacteria bacterium]